MFSVAFKPIGLARVVSKLNSITPAADKAAGDALAESALLVHSTAIKSIQAHQSRGITYGKHTASAPGSPPNTDTGDLVRSIAFNVDSSKLTAEVGTNLRTGAWLEFGTANIAPRPWLFPAFRDNLQKIQKIFAAVAKEVLRVSK